MCSSRAWQGSKNMLETGARWRVGVGRHISSWQECGLWTGIPGSATPCLCDSLGDTLALDLRFPIYRVGITQVSPSQVLKGLNDIMCCA